MLWTHFIAKKYLSRHLSALVDRLFLHDRLLAQRPKMVPIPWPACAGAVSKAHSDSQSESTPNERSWQKSSAAWIRPLLSSARALDALIGANLYMMITAGSSITI